jgi:hypothetical protein
LSASQLGVAPHGRRRAEVRAEVDALEDGPENGDTLVRHAPKGRKASGWLVYEVPAKGQILLSYKGNMFSDAAPVFEVVLRSK